MPLAPELPTVAATPVEGPQDDLEKYLALPTESNFDLDVLAWWKARDHTTRRRTQRAAARKACRTLPRWRGCFER